MLQYVFDWNAQRRTGLLRDATLGMTSVWWALLLTAKSFEVNVSTFLWYDTQNQQAIVLQTWDAGWHLEPHSVGVLQVKGFFSALWLCNIFHLWFRGFVLPFYQTCCSLSPKTAFIHSRSVVSSYRFEYWKLLILWGF